MLSNDSGRVHTARRPEMHAPTPTNPRRGFTLIEVMVVVLLLGIVALAVLPAIGGRASLKLSAASRLVVANLQYAQTHAISTNKWTVVVFNLSGNTVTIYERDSISAPMVPLAHPTNPGDFVTRFGNGAPGGLSDVRLAAVNFQSRPAVAFDDLGVPHYLAANGNGVNALVFTGNVTLACNGVTQRIEVAPNTGEVTTP